MNEIYNFFKYFELKTDEYEGNPAGYRCGNMKQLSLFSAVLTKLYWKNGSQNTGGLPCPLTV